MKSVHWREGARRDLDDAAEWYAQQGGETLELRFVAAVESTVLMVRQHPVVGSTRHAGYVTDLPAPLRYFRFAHSSRTSSTTSTCRNTSK